MASNWAGQIQQQHGDLEELVPSVGFSLGYTPGYTPTDTKEMEEVLHN